jgi:hypothetical protein
MAKERHDRDNSIAGSAALLKLLHIEKLAFIRSGVVPHHENKIH